MVAAVASYVIAGQTDGDDGMQLFWSNVHGWVLLSDATVFTSLEQKKMALPFGAAGWMRLPRTT